MAEPSTPFGRVRRLQGQMREKGVGGLWTPGSFLGPGRPQAGARMNLLWGPDGFVIAVARPDGRRTMALLHEAGARRPVLVQPVVSPVGAREVVRLELSDFLDVLESHTLRLAQEGRLGDNE